MINREFLLANHAALVEELRAEGFKLGRAEGLAAGAEAERTRILAVEAAAMPGCEQLVAEMKADGKTTGPEAAARIIAAYKQQNPTALGRIEADAGKLPKVPPSTEKDTPPAPAKDSAEAFDAAVAKFQGEGLSRGRAIAKAAKELPAAHTAWISNKNKE